MNAINIGRHLLDTYSTNFFMAFQTQRNITVTIWQIDLRFTCCAITDDRFRSSACVAFSGKFFNVVTIGNEQGGLTKEFLFIVGV